MKKRYIINVQHFQADIGGVVALHKLCHDLNSLGEEAYVTNHPTYPHFKAPVIDLRDRKENDVVIYPEIVIGNPLNYKHVVRWILNTPGECCNANSFYDNLKESDLIFKYSDYFTIRDESKSKGLLTTTFIDTNYFYDKPGVERKGSAFLVKKKGMQKRIHPDDSIYIPNHMQSNWALMGDLFRQIEYFYCYDNATYWPFLAALCGCISIVQPNTDMSFEEWSRKFDHMQYGVAYGLNHIEHAKNTLNLVQETILNTSTRYLATVKNLIKECEKLS